MSKASYLFAANAALCALLSFAVADIADAQRGGRGGGGGARAGGGGGAQVRSSSGSSMKSASRSTSNVNRNTNVNRNVNVDVDNDCCRGGWGDNYHPVARGAAVAATTAVVMGAYYSSLPSGCTTIVSGGVTYSQCGGYYYKPVYSGSNVQYVVVEAP